MKYFYGFYIEKIKWDVVIEAQNENEAYEILLNIESEDLFQNQGTTVEVEMIPILEEISKDELPHKTPIITK